MTPRLLCLNAGSSSLKFALIDDDERLEPKLRGAITDLGAHPQLTVVDEHGRDDRALGDRGLTTPDAAKRLFDELERRDLLASITAVGHRIVHGGQAFTGPTRLDRVVLARLDALAPLAPLHQPHNLGLVRVAMRRLPMATMVGCFDTAFHASRPQRDRHYGLPRALSAEGLVAYGFHGLSYAHSAATLRALDADAGGRAVVAHLGSGASLCAMRNGQSIATTMGFSALDGLLMATRCGSIDPGLVLHLIQDRGMDAREVARMLYQESGLRGVSGISGDMRVLLDSTEPAAHEAVELFVYRVSQSIGAMAAALGGLDTLVFTGGIGENAPTVRALVAESCGWLGVRIDAARNTRAADVLSASGSAVEVRIIRADEEREIARETRRCLQSAAA